MERPNNDLLLGKVSSPSEEGKGLSLGSSWTCSEEVSAHRGLEKSEGR